MPKANLQRWVGDLRKKNMPVIGSVISELNAISDSDESTAAHLAEVILRDPNLTSHVLRVANSVKYNYSNQQINTISRAIIQIGLKGIRAICISLLILDRLLSDQPKERVIALVAQGFHAATQAENLLSAENSADAEEVFIAALLFNLGEMSFWLSEDMDGDNADLLSDNPQKRNAAMNRIIGGSFKALTRELAKHWKLGDTVQEALYPAKTISAKAKAVIIGERLSRAALFGWESPQVAKVLDEVAEYRNVDLKEALDQVKQSADRASAVAISYGAAQACPMIPSSVKANYFEQRKTADKILKPDAQIQLSILRELTSCTQEKTDVNTIFQMVLEGMHRGIAFERVGLAFIQGHKVQVKYALGEGTEHWRSSFNFDVGPYSENIFTHALENDGALWIDQTFRETQSELYSQEIVRVLGKHPAVIFVVKVSDRNAALFYADRSNFGGVIDQEQFDSFQHFATQAQFSLNALSNKASF